MMHGELADLDRLGVVAVAVDRQGVIVEWTRGFRELIALPLDQLSARHFWTLASSQDRDSLRQVMNEVMNDRKSRRVDAAMVSGSVEHRIAWTCSFVSRSDDDLIVAWGVDITATETVDSDLRRKLATRERELSAIYANVPGILFYIGIEPDGDFRFLSASQACLDATGLTREQFVGALVREVIPQPSCDMVLNNYREAVRSGRPVRWAETSRYPAGLRHGEVAVTPLYDDNGTATRLIGIVHDVTERKNAETALREADARKTEFLATLSHELRNPLAPIRYGLAVLNQAPPGSEKAKRTREILERQVTHLTRLVDDLLDMTRITRGTIELHREPIELNALLQRTVDDHTAGFETRGVACEVVLESAELWLDADGTRLVQAIGNLLGNAMKFTRRGDRVTISLTREGDAAVLRIRDTGIGIDAETLRHLFVPFKQARQALDRREGGLGLGLSLVKALVELHGGTVAATSDGPNKGTEITLRLPLAATPAHFESAPPQRVARPRRVLVIEDNVDAAEALRSALEIDGHDVRVSHDGPAGIAIARTFRPNVVVCDLGLPGMNGYEVARVLCADRVGTPAVLVALSGYALPQDRERSEAAGFAYHLAKPPSLRELQQVLSVEVNLERPPTVCAERPPPQLQRTR
jgi:two-component system CheB/CheR fusion protein